MNAGNLKYGYKITFLLLFVLSWTYIFLRAWKVQFGIDEAATFFMYIQTGRFFPPGAAIDANNHLLNSFLSFLLYSIFGSHPLILRLPNLVAAIAFFYFIYKISGFLASYPAKIIFLFLILSSHFLIEFFGYCRGYGLSMAFMAGSIYYLILSSQQIKASLLAKSLLFNLLAILSNLNLVFTGIGIVAILIFFVFYVKNENTPKIKASLVFLILLIALPGFLFFTYQSFQIRSAAGFYYGSGDGFFPVTIESLAAVAAGQKMKIIGYYAVILFFGLITYMIIRRVWKNWKEPQLILTMLFLVLILANWTGSLGIHYLMGVNYQEDRAALHLLPLFYGFIAFGFDPILLKKKWWPYIVLLPLLIIPVHFINQVSLSDSVYGHGQQFPVKFYRYIEDKGKTSDYPPTISSYQVRRQTWDFMNHRHGGLLNPLYVPDYPCLYADMLITNTLEESIKNHFVPVLVDERTNTVLYENKEAAEASMLHEISISTAIQSKDEYHLLFQQNTDSIAGQYLLLKFDLDIESLIVPFEAVIVAEVFDSNRKTLKYSSLNLDQLRAVWISDQRQVHHSILIGEIPHEASSMIIYIWNKRKVEYTIDSGTIELYKLQYIQQEKDDY